MRWRKGTWIWSWWACEFYIKYRLTCSTEHFKFRHLFIPPFQIPSQQVGCVVVYHPLMPFNTCRFKGKRRLSTPQMTKPPILGLLTWQHSTQLATNPWAWALSSPLPQVRIISTLAVQNEDISTGDGRQGLKAKLEQQLKVTFFILHAPSLTQFPGRLCSSKQTQSHFQYPPNCTQNRVRILWCLPCFAANYCFQKTWYLQSCKIQRCLQGLSSKVLIIWCMRSVPTSVLYQRACKC